jgi:hypothetical protein
VIDPLPPQLEYSALRSPRAVAASRDPQRRLVYHRPCRDPPYRGRRCSFTQRGLRIVSLQKRCLNYVPRAPARQEHPWLWE